MGLSPEIPIGEGVRFHREAQNKKQVVVAGLAGITEVVVVADSPTYVRPDGVIVTSIASLGP